MLVLSREVNERIIITLPDGVRITIMVIEIRGHKTRIGFDAPKNVGVNRSEIQDLIDGGHGREKKE